MTSAPSAERNPVAEGLSLSRELTLGSRWTFVGGKGGVGKTTVAAALAVELADAGEPVLVLSIDPAHSLGDALGIELGPEPREVAEVHGLSALEVHAGRERDLFFEKWGAAIEIILERGTYLDAPDVRELSTSAVPGLDELAALLRLGALARDDQRRIIIDTAPTGHTLRFFDLPHLALRWLDAFSAMERKHAAVAIGLVGAYRADEAAGALQDLRSEVEAVETLLRSPSETTVVLVATPEGAVQAETERYRKALEDRGIFIGGTVVNRVRPGDVAPASPGRSIRIPWQSADPGGIQGLRRFAASALRPPVDREERPTSGGAAAFLLRPYSPPLDRSLYLVGGKGGVGKTTAATALGVALAGAGRRVLLLGVDPAGSIGDILGTAVGTEADTLTEVHGLYARQIDAKEAWAGYISDYRREVGEIFDRILAGGVAANPDREVIERLIDLAPPGLDELVGLLEVVDSSEDRRYDALVVDTAPTGHLLRLLQMPALALDWTHTLMRLLLKYRGAVRIGSLGEDLLKLSRRIRSFAEQLRDGRSAWFLAVALPESLSVPETRRLLAGVEELGIRPGAVLVNRVIVGDGVPEEKSPVLARLAALPGQGVPVAVAPEAQSPPVGPSALAAFIAGWRLLEQRAS